MGTTITARNFFSRTVSHPGGVPLTLAALKRLAGWGLSHDANNTPTTQKSADSFVSDGATILPQTSDVYVGDDQFVAAAAAVGPPVLYRGSLAIMGQPYSLTDYCRGIVADDDVWIFSALAQDIEIITLGV